METSLVNPDPENTLYYVHDPMCSWCWGFRPVWQEVIKKLPESIKVVSLLGGLAVDSDQPMPAEMQTMIHDIWKTIQQRIPGTRFNFDFWEKNTPKRSTLPACRAVIAARKQGIIYEQRMILEIQQAYYLKALNPSDNSVLINIAKALSLDTTLFEKDLSSQQTQSQLMEEIELGRSLGARGFPSLILERGNSHSIVNIDYNDADFIAKQIDYLLGR